LRSLKESEFDVSQDPIIGIDLGTTNSCVAVMIDDAVHVIPDEHGQRIQASVVSFLKDESVLIGNEARQEMISDPRNTIFSAKRFLGWPYDSKESKKLRTQLPYKVVKGEEQNSMIDVRGELYELPEIAALILHRMKDLAQIYLGQEIHRAVVTVPANFNDSQRQMTKLAGELAGLEIVRILNEPTAAALAYGYGKNLNANLAIYDLGGGTFDVTILKASGNVFEVLSTAGDTYLGGDDFDNRLTRVILIYLQKQHDFNIDLQPQLRGHIKYLAEHVKKGLTQYDRLQLNEKIRLIEYDEPIDLNLVMSRELFKSQCAEIIERSFKICDDALSRLPFGVDLIDDVILVGGSTRVPLVREMAEEYFQISPRTDIDPDEVVAIGAAIQGAMLGTTFSVEHTMNSPLLLDVTPVSIGVLTVQGICEVLITKNTAVPCEVAKVFTTTANEQTEVKIQIYQGEGRVASENIKLGELELYDIRPAKRGVVQIEVFFEVDTDGLVSVRARDLETGLAQETRVKVSSGYSDGNIDSMRNRLGATVIAIIHPEKPDDSEASSDHVQG
jgi:molecular chaperone DnaK